MLGGSASGLLFLTLIRLFIGNPQGTRQGSHGLLDRQASAMRRLELMPDQLHARADEMQKLNSATRSSMEFLNVVYKLPEMRPKTPSQRAHAVDKVRRRREGQAAAAEAAALEAEAL